jgi:hypothetical protein
VTINPASALTLWSDIDAHCAVSEVRTEELEFLYKSLEDTCDLKKVWPVKAMSEIIKYL